MLWSMYRSVLIPIRDFIYPPVCFTCDQLLHEHESRVCSACWNSFSQVHPCHPTWVEIKSKFQQEEFVEDILSCFLFEKEGKLQSVIHLLKYQGMKSLGARLGEELGRRMLEHPVFSKVDYLIPIPLHKLKKRERGYNQAEYLCKGISAVTGIPVHSRLMLRTKYTDSQTQLDLDQRRNNVGDAFVVNSQNVSLVEGRSFILVDDVITTGSSINACARQLTARGAGRVLAASAALAQ